MEGGDAAPDPAEQSDYEYSYSEQSDDDGMAPTDDGKHNNSRGIQGQIEVRFRGAETIICMFI